MHDPFIPAPDFIVEATKPLASVLALQTIPFHAHEILLGFSFYELVSRSISPAVSARLFPRTYSNLQRKTKIDWDVHFVSMVQSCFINAVALWVIFKDQERSQMDAA
jgi:hypothetical protein